MRVIFSRFQGALLGGFVARDLKDRGSNLKVSTLRIQSSNESILENLLRVIQFCVDSQSFQELDWNQLRFKEILPQGLEGDLRSFPRVIDRAIALTPLALLLQDNPALLDQQIEKIARIWWPQTSAPNHLESLQIVLKAIALICQGTDRGYCRPSRFMPTVLDYLAADSILGIQCGQVQALIEQRAGLETAIETLSQPLLGCKDPAIESVYQDSLGIALALFYFLDTPEDFSLTVLRSLRAGTLAPASCILSSIFSGAYNGLENIPVGWRSRSRQFSRVKLGLQGSQPFSKSIKPLSAQSKPLAKLSSKPIESGVFLGSESGSEAEVLHLGSQLFALWSGIYQGSLPYTQTNSAATVTSSRLTRSAGSLSSILPQAHLK